jgi:hypothetical protein
MNFLRDNEALILLYTVLIVVLVMAIAFAPALRMGQESAFAHYSVREVISGIARNR